jgi:hypothetical protein
VTGDRPLYDDCVNTFRIRLLFVAALAAAFILTFAVPASASTTVLATDKYKWFYWIGFVLAVSFVGWLIAMSVGYYVRVLRPKWRGQKQS